MPVAIKEDIPKTSHSKILALNEIQGNILSGFNKDFQAFIFLRFDNAEQGKLFLRSISHEIASTSEVQRFNQLFKELKALRGGELGALKATWANIAFTFTGLKALGLNENELNQLPVAFKEGMRKRAAALGDTGRSASTNWILNGGGPEAASEIHALLIVASDTQSDLHQHVMRYLSLVFLNGGITLVFLQDGAVRSDQPGHEHFGFKDGISQPGIRSFTHHSPAADPGQGAPGQDLLWPGEFVVGYETQFGKADPKNPDDLNLAPGPISQSGPAWTENGSYLVFRRLQQDVPAFQDQLMALSAAHGIAPEILGAKLVGRYKSGCPLERTKAHPSLPTNNGDPSVHHPDLLAENVNNFEYDKDSDGKILPRPGHIRKAYPRNETATKPACDGLPVNENTTQKHRILRRGIPFGTSFRPTLGAQSHPVHVQSSGPINTTGNRGLLFLAYQSDLERQFEFIQKCWVNDENFPEKGDGQDPIMAQSSGGNIDVPGMNGGAMNVNHFVTTTGGDYFFQPAISVIAKLGRKEKL